MIFCAPMRLQVQPISDEVGRPCPKNTDPPLARLLNT
jgi:hypothetical protein